MMEVNKPPRVLIAEHKATNFIGSFDRVTPMTDRTRQILVEAVHGDSFELDHFIIALGGLAYQTLLKLEIHEKRPLEDILVEMREQSARRTYTITEKDLKPEED